MLGYLDDLLMVPLGIMLACDLSRGPSWWRRGGRQKSRATDEPNRRGSHRRPLDRNGGPAHLGILAAPRPIMVEYAMTIAPRVVELR